MEGKEIQNKTTGELVEMMRDKVQELIDAEADEISAPDAIVLLKEAILLGAVVIGTVEEQPISMILGALAGDVLGAELIGEIEAAMVRANIARMN